MADLLKQGTLKAEQNPLDRRGKLLKRADVEALAWKAGRLGKMISRRRRIAEAGE
jgi:hypothetical protein